MTDNTAAPGDLDFYYWDDDDNGDEILCDSREDKLVPRIDSRFVVRFAESVHGGIWHASDIWGLPIDARRSLVRDFCGHDEDLSESTWQQVACVLEAWGNTR